MLSAKTIGAGGAAERDGVFEPLDVAVDEGVRDEVGETEGVPLTDFVDEGVGLAVTVVDGVRV